MFTHKKLALSLLLVSGFAIGIDLDSGGSTLSETQVSQKIEFDFHYNNQEALEYLLKTTGTLAVQICGKGDNYHYKFQSDKTVGEIVEIFLKIKNISRYTLAAALKGGVCATFWPDEKSQNLTGALSDSDSEDN